MKENDVMKKEMGSRYVYIAPLILPSKEDPSVVQCKREEEIEDNGRFNVTQRNTICISPPLSSLFII